MGLALRTVTCLISKTLVTIGDKTHGFTLVTVHYDRRPSTGNLMPTRLTDRGCLGETRRLTTKRSGGCGGSVGETRSDLFKNHCGLQLDCK